jgi:hypothetical protein
VQGGALSWDDRFDDIARQDGEEYVRDRMGRRARVGTPGAAWVAYELIVEMHRRLYKLEELLQRSMTEARLEEFMRGFRQSGVYDLSGLNRRQMAILTAYVSSWIQLATCFRVMARLYRGATMPSTMRPTRYAIQRIDLSRLIIRTSPYNPINVDPPDRTLTIHTPGQWEIFGLQALQSFQSAYPTIVDVSAEDAALVRQDIEETGRRAGTMGGALVSIGWMVAIIIVGVAVASAIRKGLSAFLLYMGVDIEFKDALIERFEEELDSCLSGNEAACARADALADRIEQFDNGIGRLFRTIVVLSVVGVGGAWTFVWWKRGGRDRVRRLWPGRQKRQLRA